MLIVYLFSFKKHVCEVIPVPITVTVKRVMMMTMANTSSPITSLVSWRIMKKLKMCQTQ